LLVRGGCMVVGAANAVAETPDSVNTAKVELPMMALIFCSFICTP